MYAQPRWQISVLTGIRTWYSQVTSPSRYEWAIGVDFKRVNIIQIWQNVGQRFWSLRPKKNIVCSRFPTDPIKTCATQIYFMDSCYGWDLVTLQNVTRRRGLSKSVKKQKIVTYCTDNTWMEVHLAPNKRKKFLPTDWLKWQKKMK